MPEPVTPTSESQESLGWRAGLPDDLKQNETFKPFKTVGEFGKHHLETVAKLTDAEAKLKDSVPMLPDDATDEEKGIYFDALGRPKEAKDYEFDGEDKNAPEWTNFWKTEFHSLGLTKAQAKALSAKWNGQMQRMVEAHNAAMQKEQKEAEQKLRDEMGNKFDANVELAKRLYAKHLGGEFDKEFANGSAGMRFQMIRYLVKLAALTGEDKSPQSTAAAATAGKGSFINYDKSPEPPKR